MNSSLSWHFITPAATFHFIVVQFTKFHFFSPLQMIHHRTNVHAHYGMNAIYCYRKPESQRKFDESGTKHDEFHLVLIKTNHFISFRFGGFIEKLFELTKNKIV